jgi:hypothetical protein
VEAQAQQGQTYSLTVRGLMPYIFNDEAQAVSVQMSAIGQGQTLATATLAVTVLERKEYADAYEYFPLCTGGAGAAGECRHASFITDIGADSHIWVVLGKGGSYGDGHQTIFKMTRSSSYGSGDPRVAAGGMSGTDVLRTSVKVPPRAVTSSDDAETFSFISGPGRGGSGEAPGGDGKEYPWWDLSGSVSGDHRPYTTEWIYHETYDPDEAKGNDGANAWDDSSSAAGHIEYDRSGLGSPTGCPGGGSVPDTDFLLSFMHGGKRYRFRSAGGDGWGDTRLGDLAAPLSGTIYEILYATRDSILQHQHGLLYGYSENMFSLTCRRFPPARYYLDWSTITKLDEGMGCTRKTSSIGGIMGGGGGGSWKGRPFYGGAEFEPPMASPDYHGSALGGFFLGDGGYGGNGVVLVRISEWEEIQYDE